ncbi:hypothetical protein [Geotalea sp. SG265]|uniref:hypothetical protein n=1 Tax=Geotalea sp. SG265 TaxID=2922867 RepID=UPI001FAEB339|nr:hypothetical protein [Geotalea sp. SG265]
MKTAIISIMILLPTLALAAHSHKEREYQQAWCENVKGTTEYRLDDGTRVDCITEQYAVEFDFAPKWAESVGQALYYAEMTGRKPGVVLILEKATDTRYVDRLKKIADRYGIMQWIMTLDDIDKLATGGLKQASRI